MTVAKKVVKVRTRCTDEREIAIETAQIIAFMNAKLRGNSLYMI